MNYNFSREDLEALPKFEMPDIGKMIRACLTEATLAKEVHELTEGEKFAIAYIAGVPLQHGRINDDPAYKLHTVPCGIYKTPDGVFHVVVESPRAGQQITVKLLPPK